MTVTAAADFDRERFVIESRRWGICFTAILAVHVVGFWLALAWRPEAEMPPAGPPAVAMIELAPLPVAPPVETPPVQRQEQVKPPPVEETAPPSPAPIVTAPLPPKPKPVKHQPDRRPPPVTAAPVEAPSSPAPVAPPTAAIAPRPANAVPSWQGLLLSRLEQFKRYPASAVFRHQQGVVYLHFTMDRQGQVLSARIDKTSGFDALDEEALALVRRAAPLPPPPPEIPGNPVALTVPVQFFLK